MTDDWTKQPIKNLLRERKKPDRQARRRKTVACPAGCGGFQYREGICDDCQALIELGQAALRHDLRNRAGVVKVDDYETFRDACVPYETRQAWQKALGELADTRELVNVRGNYFGQDVLPHLDTLPYDRQSSGTSGDLYLVLTPRRAKALRRLLDIMGGLVDSAHHEGVHRGRSILAGLAEGKITPADYDKGEMNRAKQAQAAGRRARGESVPRPKER